MHRSLLVVVALAGCAGVRDNLEDSPASLLEADGVETYDVLESVGVAPHRVVVRALNRFGAGVASDPQAFTVDGTQVFVQFDGGGYGSITRFTAGVAEITGGLETVQAHTVETEWPGADLDRLWPATVEEPAWTRPVTGGALVVSGTDVWWSGDATPAHRVLVADGPILGLETGPIDVDGFDDALVWTASTVFMLRGNRNGGMSWGGALTAGDLGVGGAAMDDLSGDNLPDIAVAWASSDGGGWIDVWEGDGLFAFTPASPRRLLDTPIDVSIGDNTGEGEPQITVLQEGQDWVRFINGAPGRYIPIGPRTPSTAGIRPGSSFLEPGDINDDGAEDLPVAAPRVDGERRLIEVFDLSLDEEGTPWLPLEDEPGAYAALEDGDGDGIVDIWVLHDTSELLAVHYAPGEVSNASFRKSLVFPELAERGPMAVSDLDRDGAPELFVAGPETWWRWRGANAPSDPEVFWFPRGSELVQVREAVEPSLALAEIDGGPDTLELVTFTIEGGQTVLKILQHTPGEGRAPQLGAEVISDTGAPVDDLAVCGNNAYVLAGGTLARVSLSNPAAPSIGSTRDTTSPVVTCGDGPDGAAAGVIEAGEVVLLAATLVERGTNPAPGARDLAFGDVGDGPEVRTCDTEGCDIVAWPWGAAGEVSFVTADADGMRIVEATGDTPLGSGSGQLTVADLDRDGNLDLLALDADNRITLHRSTGASAAPAEQWHQAGGWRGVVLAADGDGDGWPDLWGVDALGDLTFTQPPRAPEETIGTTDTGDTGDTGTPTTETAHTGDTASPTTGTTDTADTADTGP